MTYDDDDQMEGREVRNATEKDKHFYIFDYCIKDLFTGDKGDNGKSLGVMLDELLSMDRQIASVKKKCCWTMMNLRTIWSYLGEEVKLMMVKQLVISKLDYCNVLCMNLAKKRLKKIKSVLNQGIRFICTTSKTGAKIWYRTTRRLTYPPLNRGYSTRSAFSLTKQYMVYHPLTSGTLLLLTFLLISPL